MTPPALVGTVLDGKFQIERALASGAAGDVYEAIHLGLGSRVAVKVLRPCSPETAGIRRKRFVREARVAARIQSEHVVRVFDIVAPDEGPTYIVMELLQGETLQERVRRLGAIPALEAVDYVLQAAKPLAEMHDAGIVHRDVKPSNVFLARDADGNERIKLLDFGVAAFQQPVPRQRDSALTFTDAIVGTPRYMAPEQVRASKNVDARADVWALGVTLYELLAGAPPFDGQTVLAVLHQIERQNPPKLAERRPDIPHDLAAVVHRCLAKDPAERPADARALSRALSAFHDEDRGRRPVDPLDLSLSDENVEVVAGLPPMTLRARLAATASTRKAVAAIALSAVALALLTFAATRGGRTAAEPAGPRETPVVTSSAPSAPSAPPQVPAARGPASGDAPGRVLVTTEPQREREAPSTASVTATAHRALPEPARAPAAQRRSGKPAGRSPSSSAKGSAPHPSEDDDRIE